MDRYRPTSEFLMMALDDEIPFDGNVLAEANLARLIELTADADTSNRDWATMLLVHTGISTPAVCAALRREADDEHVDTRCEALIGLAVIDPAFALPRVRAMLKGDETWTLTLEAAGLLGDPSLAPLLAQWAELRSEDDDALFDWELSRALEACRTGTPVEPYFRGVAEN